jgi:hypothetical protein
MTLRLRIPAHLIAALVIAHATGTTQAHQLIGYVNTHDAEVTGASDVLNGQAVLTGSAGVTARDHTAEIKLGRGGTVHVCQSSALHVTESKAATTSAPLLFSLDRGAIEIQMSGTRNDAIMTPDLRFTVSSAGPLDLRLRVARNGDTCIENRGASAPMLAISDPFGETTYQVAAGQHVLFEHGSVREVVDHEPTACGCPDDQGLSVADALLASGGGAASSMAHPFPAAVSEGLAPAPEVPQSAPGVVHMQISDSLSYNATAPEMAAPAPAASPAQQPAAQPPAPPKRDVVHVVGRFFKRLFGG